MRIISWNVNGLRAVARNGAWHQLPKPDLLCIQELRCDVASVPERVTQDWKCAYINAASKKGYAGTACFTDIEPLSVAVNLPPVIEPHEGRTLTLEYPEYYVVNTYTPNSGAELKRLLFRAQTWNLEFKDYLLELNARKPVIVCGDLNVAHQPIDLEHPEVNHMSAGYTDAEREGFSQLLEAGFVDVFRHFYPDIPKKYTWWSYRMRARARNVGWRIDYFLVSRALVSKVKSIRILEQVGGSDHAPVEMII